MFPSSGVPNLDCKAGPKETVNQITHWLDVSNVYGSDPHTQNKVRRFRHGLLEAFNVKGRDQLPINREPDMSECPDPQGMIILSFLQPRFG